MTNIETLADIKLRKEAKEASASAPKTRRTNRYSQKIKQVRADYKNLTGNEYGTGGYFVFRYDIYEGWIQDLEEPRDWLINCIAVDEKGNQFRSVGPLGAAWATKWEPSN